jgi:pilus assembly protein CpaF
VVLSEIYKFEMTGVGEDGQVVGEMRPTGIRPMFEYRLKAAGFELTADMFGAGMMRPPRAQRSR